MENENIQDKNISIKKEENPETNEDLKNNMEIIEPGQDEQKWGESPDYQKYNSQVDSSKSKSSERMNYKDTEIRYDQNYPNIRQKDPNAKPPVLDFLIFISTQIKDSLLDNKILDSIIAQIGGITMDFDLDFKIPEYNGCLLKIKGNDIKKKRDATQQLLEFIVKNDLDHPNEPQKRTEKIAIIIMIPNGLVSMIIGTHGKQISNLIRDSKASIIINQPIYKMTYRTVTISGCPESIANGIMLIQQIMEDRYNEVNKIEFESPPLNIMTTQTNVKIVLTDYIADRITTAKKHGISFLKYLNDQFDVSISIFTDRKNRQLDRKDLICSIKGTINNVQSSIMQISEKIREYIKTTYDGKESYQLRVLINKAFVTKLIGAAGCMIQEIANFAKGASIKIMSNKNDEKKNNYHDIPLCIAGSFHSVQDATCIIIEQMECFKNGGPVLKSGKSLHDNIAVQFMNSIFTNAVPGENEDEHIYTLKDRFNSNNMKTIINSSGVSNQNQSEQGYNNISEPMINEIPYRRGSGDMIRKYNNESNNIIRDYNDSRSRSGRRHNMRSRSRDREREHEKEKNYKGSNQRSRSKSYSRSNSRNYHRSHSKMDEYHKRERVIDKNAGNNPYTRPLSYFSYIENGVTKINTDFTVPNRLVSYLIGKKGENVRAIMNQTGAVITFSKEYNDDGRIITSCGPARLCNLKGTVKQNMEAMGKILELIIKNENVGGQNMNQK